MLEPLTLEEVIYTHASLTMLSIIVALVDALSRRLPKPVKVVRQEDYLGEKDANDILRKYGTEALRQAVANARIIPVTHIKELADVAAVDLSKLPKINTGIAMLDRVIGGL